MPRGCCRSWPHEPAQQHVMEQSVDACMLYRRSSFILRECILERIVEQIVDVPVLEFF